MCNSDLIVKKLPLEKQVNRFVVAKYKNKELWFDSEKVKCVVSNGEVEVTLTEKSWRGRIYPTQHVVKPMREVERNKKKCMLCKEEVFLEKNLRICDSCKSTQNWQEGNYCFGHYV